MELMEAIRNRRSIGRVKPDAVDQALIEQVIESAISAPNHHLTEPWRFIVMTGEGRRRLGDAYAAIAAESTSANTSPPLSAEDQLKQHNNHLAKAFRAPVVIAVAVSPSGDPKIP